MKIGFFDSGLGGLTILRAVAKHLPEYDYEFYGDTANLPYGSKSEAEIFNLTQKGVEHLFKRDCMIVIIACNTASAETARKLQDVYLKENYPERRILGVIVPTMEEVAEQILHKVLLIGTTRTIESGKYLLEAKKIEKTPEIISIATPELVSLIEEGNLEQAYDQVVAVIETAGEIDGVILGCTHYSLLLQKLSEQYPELQFFSQDLIIPQKLKNYLERHPELENQLSHGKQRSIYLTDNGRRYDHIIQELLSVPLVGEA